MKILFGLVLLVLVTGADAAGIKQHLNHAVLSRHLDLTQANSIDLVCGWMETKALSDNAVAEAQVPKYPKRRWIRYDKKIQRWFFKNCKELDL